MANRTTPPGIQRDARAAVEARGVTRVLEGPVPVTLVRDIDARFDPGELVAVRGPSGSGKSSLLYLLGLLDRPTSGEILVDGVPTQGLAAERMARLRLERLGFVFQFHFLLPEFSIRDNMLLPMRKLRRLDEHAMRARADSVLADLGLASEADKRPDQLSGGQRQRAAIARALANEPGILLADEPTGNLDTRNAATVFDVFQRLAHEQGKCVITVTHDPDLAARCDREVTIVDGRIEAP
jgi:lipoprotein-releasing system ATP-binding protein